MAGSPTSPDTPSSDYEAMRPYWLKVATILAGADAMRAAGETYLPRFASESDLDYEARRLGAKFTNLFDELTSGLADKPFAEKVSLDEASVPARAVAFAEDIDGRGNNLHVFAGTVFRSAIHYAVTWILIDYAKAKAGASLAEERAAGVRPYWIHVPALSLLAVYADTINGKEQFTHVRIAEVSKVRDGFDEVCRKRVRIFDRAPILDEAGQVIGYAKPTFQLWEQATGKETGWKLIDEGNLSIDIIPLVPFITGQREGASWVFKPPMLALADAQIEHYQAETGLKDIKGLTAYPMLAANGVQPAMEGGQVVPVPVGPRQVMYAPPIGENGQHGEWKFIEPQATSLQFLASDVKTIEQQMRELGRQPLSAQTGNLTVVTTAFAAEKGNSAVKAWALGLKDALEQAWVITAAWLKESAKPVVSVFTDFDTGADDAADVDLLKDMRRNKDISGETYRAEAKRRGVLSADFDEEAEVKRLEAEAPDEDSEEDLEAAGAVA